MLGAREVIGKKIQVPRVKEMIEESTMINEVVLVKQLKNHQRSLEEGKADHQVIDGDLEHLIADAVQDHQAKTDPQKEGLDLEALIGDAVTTLLVEKTVIGEVGRKKKVPGRKILWLKKIHQIDHHQTAGKNFHRTIQSSWLCPGMFNLCDAICKVNG